MLKVSNLEIKLVFKFLRSTLKNRSRPRSNSSRRANALRPAKKDQNFKKKCSTRISSASRSSHSSPKFSESTPNSVVGSAASKRLAEILFHLQLIFKPNFSNASLMYNLYFFNSKIILMQFITRAIIIFCF